MVLDLSGTSVSSLPSSVSLLTNLQALYLDDCKRIVDISILGNLKKLILGMKNLQIINKRGIHRKEMPKEIGCFASLKMLDVTDACFETVPSNVLSNLKGLEELYMTCDFCDWGRSIRPERGILSFAVGKNANFDELTGLSRLNSLKVHIRDVKCLPQTVRNNPNWVNFHICIRNKDCMSQSYYLRFLERILTDKLDPRCFRYVTLNTSINFIPYCSINVVMEKAEMLDYIEYYNVSNILEEYDRGRLYSLKYLAIIDCSVQRGWLMNSGIRNEAVFESLEELYLEEVFGLEELCVGELPRGSLCKLKLLNVRNCQNLHGVLLQPKLLQRLQSLESLHCECTEDAGVLLEYVFGYDGLEPEQMVLTKLREITLCYLVNLISIWNGPAPYQVFCNLKSLALRGCHKLKSVFPSSVADCLEQLELLWVEECSGLETVIESWETEINEVVFPQLKDIYLSSLLQLTGIYSDIRGIPIIHKVFCRSLEHLYVYGCPKLSNLAVFDLRRGNQVQANNDGHFAIIFERLFHRQFNPEKIPQFFSKKSSDDFLSSRAYGSDKEGIKFDDGIYSTVRQLVLHYNERSVNCIQIVYDRYGISHCSDKHGHPNGVKTTVTLDYPDEFITAVEGKYAAAGPWVGIGSLLFVSNKNIYGPFGFRGLDENLVRHTFLIEKQGSRIVGFHGTYSRVFGLREIGAHFKACSEWP